MHLSPLAPPTRPLFFLFFPVPPVFVYLLFSRSTITATNANATGLFSPGTHSKNVLMVPIRLRQQRVRPVTPVAADKGKTVAGIERWPALSAFAEEQRQGGGTLLDADR